MQAALVIDINPYQKIQLLEARLRAKTMEADTLRGKLNAERERYAALDKKHQSEYSWRKRLQKSVKAQGIVNQYGNKEAGVILPELVATHVKSYFRIAAIPTGDRLKGNVYIRQVYFYLLKQLTSLSLSDIAKAGGRTDHSTADRAITALTTRLHSGEEELRQDIENLVKRITSTERTNLVKLTGQQAAWSKRLRGYKVEQLSAHGDVLATFATVNEAALAVGVSIGTISKISRGKQVSKQWFFRYKS